MKRNRKASGEKDTAKAVDPAKKPKHNHTLEEVRAKLEQARLKKLAAEERLLRQKQQQNSVGQPTNSNLPSANIAKQKSRAQEAQEALDRARSRFRVVQQQQYSTGANPTQNYSDNTKPWNRNKRQYYGSQNQSSLPPISALSSTFSLKITNIADSGPPEIVYHCPDSVQSPWSSIGPIGSRAALIQFLGGTKAVEALQLARDDKDVSTRQKKTANTKKASKKTKASKKSISKKAASASLLQRKIKLQNDLLALKEKLEMKSSQEKQKTSRKNVVDSADARNDDGNKERKLPSTKEGLERRKAEAQTVMGISYWKHFVSKQEHLLEQVTTKINNMDKSKGGAYKECLEKRHATNKAISKVQQELNILEQRQAVVEDGIVTSTQQLLDTRQALHQAKTLREA